MDHQKYRIGTTSYIIADDILPNVRYLADQVDDIELVLFEVDDGSNNLPDEETIQALMRLAAAYQLSYTVHLPLDIKLGGDGDDLELSLVKAKHVIDCTRPLNPAAFVLHLDGQAVRGVKEPGVKRGWERQALSSLERLGEWAGDLQRLAVENLENYPPDFWDTVLEQIPVSRCVDIGHLWLDGHAPIPYLQKRLFQTRVMHIHGIQGRDHQSLSHVAQDELLRVIRYLIQADYDGVLTLEIFNEHDFVSSMDALQTVYERLEEK
jgi:sugar phosphate isomerase/epimerase